MRAGVAELRARPETTPAEAALLARVQTAVHQADAMYLGDPVPYLWTGLSAVAAIERSLVAAGAGPPARILDYAGGYGRVLRFLRAAYPEADLSHADLDEGARRFCSERLGVSSSMRITGPHDLIWCGSLLTHLDSGPLTGLLREFAVALAPRGVAVVTTHGAFAAAHEDTLAPLDPGDRAAVRDAFDRTGFGYADYPGLRDYGASFTSTQWLHEAARSSGLEPVLTEERGSANHQDVHALVRDQSSDPL